MIVQDGKDFLALLSSRAPCSTTPTVCWSRRAPTPVRTVHVLPFGEQRHGVGQDHGVYVAKAIEVEDPGAEVVPTRAGAG